MTLSYVNWLEGWRGEVERCMRERERLGEVKRGEGRVERVSQKNERERERDRESYEECVKSIYENWES